MNEDNIITGNPAPEPFRSGELFADDLSHDRLNEWLDQLTADRETLSTALTDWRRAFARAQAERESLTTRRDRALGQVSSVRVMRDRDRYALESALRQIHGDAGQITDETVKRDWLKVAIHAGILNGYASEAHALARESGWDDDDETVWREVSDALRREDGTYPEPVSADEATGTAYGHYRYRSTVANHHPADPRLGDMWRHLYRVAKTSSMCGVFDDLAQSLGVPAGYEPTYSGTVDIRFSGYVTVSVENVDPDDALDMVDESDIIQALRDGNGSLDIDEYDTDLTPDDE